jgi:hypothetical protein
MLSMWSPKIILKYFKLKYLSNHQHYKMIKFGSTTVEVLYKMIKFGSTTVKILYTIQNVRCRQHKVCHVINVCY